MLPFSIMFSDAQVLPFWTVIYNGPGRRCSGDRAGPVRGVTAAAGHCGWAGWLGSRPS